MTKMTSRTLKSILMATVAVGGVGFAGAVSAQEAAKADEKVTVTGTRIRSRDFQAISPITTVGSQQLELTQTTNVEGLLNELPQLIPGNTVTSNNAGGEDFATLDLRGLGPGRTLILLNGNRMTPSSTTGVVDINTIPAGLIDRIEVVSGGASAVYGSDAMAGAINFILKKNYEGAQGSITYGSAERGLGREVNADFLIGGNFGDGKGNVTAYGSYYTREGVKQNEFDFSRVSAATQGIYNTVTGAVVDVRVADRSSEWLTLAETQAIYGANFAPFTYSSGGSITPPWGNFSSPGNAIANYTTIPAIAPRFTAVDNDCRPDTAAVNVTSGNFSFNDAGQMSPFLATGGVGGCRVPDRAAGSSRYNFAPDNYIIIPGERYNMTVTGNYELDHGMRLEVLANYVNSQTTVVLAPTPVTHPFATPAGSVNFDIVLTPAMQAMIAAENPDVWAALQTRANPLGNVRVNNWRSTAVGPREATNINHSFSTQATLAGTIFGDWDWNLNASYGRVQFHVNSTNSVNRTALLQGIRGCQDNAGNPLPGVLPGCVPVNLFGGPGGLSEAAANFIRVNTQEDNQFEQSRVTGYVAGDLFELPGGAVSAVFGAEYRLDQATKIVDDQFRTGDIAGFNAIQDQRGAVDVFEAFTEIKIPLVSETTLFHYLGVEGGYRISDYSSAGITHTYKYGAEWAPFEFMRFRGVYNKATRAPSVFELFLNGDQGFPAYADPCNDGPARNGTAGLNAFCQAQRGIPFFAGDLFAQSNSQVQQLSFGNPNLTPETGETITAGVVFQTGEWWDLGRVRTSVDYYEIELTNLIGSRGATTVLASCYGNQGVGAQAIQDCAAITYDPITGQITNINGSLVNSAGIVNTKGIDIQFDWTVELDDLIPGLPGRLNINELYSITDSFNSGGTELAGTTSGGIGGSTPDYKSVLSVTYGLDDWTFFTRWSYVPELDQDGSQGALGLGTTGVLMQPAASYIDASVRWYPWESVDLTLGVSNIMDENPPQTALGTFDQANTDPQLYRVLGREWSLTVRSKF